jgi:hypothetical protein
MLRQPSSSGTVPGHHGMWSAQELDEEWLAIATGPASQQWLDPPREPELPGEPAPSEQWLDPPRGPDPPNEPKPPSEPELPSESEPPNELKWADEFEWASEPAGHFAVGAGFAEGGLLDRLTPGPALAGFAQNAWADHGLGALSDDSLVGVLRAWRRLASWAAAGELAAVAELDRRRKAEVEAGADPHLAEHVGDELAASLTLTTRSADALLDIACGLARLPLTRAALAAGQLDRVKALVITEGVAGLDDAHAAAVETAVIGRAPGQTSGQLRAATQRAVLAVDPAATERRREEARKDARVEVWDERCGTAALAGRDLPPADVLAADKRIDALARQLKSAGRQESLSELRAQVYLALLLGQPVEGLTSGQPPGLGIDPGPGLTGSVNLTMPLATWLGASAEPGEAAGFGPLPPDDARALADLLARQPGARQCLTLTGPDGHAIAHGCIRAGSLRVGQPRGKPWSGRDGPAGREPAAARAGPPDGWELNVTVRPLAVGRCLHERESKGYQPAPSLRHVVNVRGCTCGFPGCRNPAARCDQDHTIAYGQGGRTCECNLACLCRRHHQAKQAQGWWLDQPQPGALVWRLPHGRSYRVEPTVYPG